MTAVGQMENYLSQHSKGEEKENEYIVDFAGAKKHLFDFVMYPARS